jgi:hypothetical protein
MKFQVLSKGHKAFFSVCESRAAFSQQMRVIFFHHRIYSSRFTIVSRLKAEIQERSHMRLACKLTQRLLDSVHCSVTWRFRVAVLHWKCRVRAHIFEHRFYAHVTRMQGCEIRAKYAKIRGQIDVFAIYTCIWHIVLVFNTRVRVFRVRVFRARAFWRISHPRIHPGNPMHEKLSF